MLRNGSRSSIVPSLCFYRYAAPQPSCTSALLVNSINHLTGQLTLQDARLSEYESLPRAVRRANGDSGRHLAITLNAVQSARVLFGPTQLSACDVGATNRVKKGGRAALLVSAAKQSRTD